jgi:hypothetical protein
MRIPKALIVLAGLLFLLFFTSCYTVMMVPKHTVTRYVETEDAVYEEDSYEDVLDEYDGEAEEVIHENYYYGDLWYDNVYFDPFWTSPYWWYYA